MKTTRPRPVAHRYSRWGRLALGRHKTLGSVALALALSCGAPTLAQAAGPREDVKTAYDQARDQFNNLDLEAARATLEAALARAQGEGLTGDPALAPLHAMRAGIVYSATGDRGQTLAALGDAVRADYNVTLPIELRSQELQSMLDEARSGAERPSTDAIVHTPPSATAGADIFFEALVNTQVPDNSQVVLYWRSAGSDAEYSSLYMDLFGNLGTATIAAAEHGDQDIEYFFYAFDQNQQALANKGDRENPLTLALGGVAAGEPGTADDGGGGDEGGGDDEGKKDDDPKKPKGKSGLPRVFINLGVGTGFGIARGEAELTFQQYTPGTPGSPYTTREQACAIERWFAAGAPLASNNQEFLTHLQNIQSALDVLPSNADAMTLATAYNSDYCNRHHPVSTGLASAPFHIAPEIGIRVGQKIVLSLYSRLQVVTGSRVEGDDPGKELTASYMEDVRSPNPAGVRRKHPFSWSIGAKFKYFFGKDDKKFRLFGGGFAGYGFARLRVPMGFSNDRNGNSVPDTQEVGLTGALDQNMQIIPSTCVPVWPYNQGCDPGSGDVNNPSVGDLDRQLAQSVRQSTSSTDERVDTVKIGPGFVGVLFGFNYQLHKNFAVFAELDVGGWFPDTGSLLFDVNVGPAITF